MAVVAVGRVWEVNVAVLRAVARAMARAVAAVVWAAELAPVVTLKFMRHTDF